MLSRLIAFALLSALVHAADASSLADRRNNATQHALMARMDGQPPAAPPALTAWAPLIPRVWSNQETVQLRDAFDDALELCTMVFMAPQKAFDDVYNKYFSEADFDMVMAVFEKILGPFHKGHPQLADITVVQDYPHQRTGMSCGTVHQIMAELRDWNTPNPKLIVCPGTGFGHGGINKGYPGAPAAACHNLGGHTSWRMDTLGAILLHEYTHFRDLMAPPLTRETSDRAYGPWESFFLDKREATLNADSYAWFATELYWTVTCGVEFLDPLPDDDDDGNCSNGVCQG